jgi:hypothetical protein
MRVFHTLPCEMMSTSAIRGATRRSLTNEAKRERTPVAAARLLAGFLPSLNLGFSYLACGNQRFDALLGEVFAMCIHAIAKQVTS